MLHAGCTHRSMAGSPTKTLRLPRAMAERFEAFAQRAGISSSQAGRVLISLGLVEVERDPEGFADMTREAIAEACARTEPRTLDTDPVGRTPKAAAS